MRILRLDLEQGHTCVDLHPFLTVVRCLDEGQRAELIAAIRCLATGSVAGIRGLVQRHDQLIELDGSTGTALSPGTGADVIVDADAAVVDAALEEDRLAEAARRTPSGPLDGSPAGRLGGDMIKARIGLVAAQVALDACGSRPVALVGSLASLDDEKIGELVEHVGRLVSGLQVVIVSDHSAAATWAEVAGMSRALVTGPRSPRWPARPAGRASSRPGPSAS